MKVLMALGAAAALVVLAAAPSKAEPRRNKAVHLAAAPAQSMALRKPASTVKSVAPRKKKRCF